MRFTLLSIGCIVAFANISFSQKDAPKLVVGIVVDQMSYDYLYRFYPQFGKDGFKRLMDKGSNFRNVTYNYVPTYTGPGHASIYTGTTPSNHGIVANDWYSRQLNKEVNCVEDPSVAGVGTTSVDGLKSPLYLRANTITDQLRLTYPNSKVIGMSIKDRGAILPAGHLSNGSYWYDYSSGNFISSTFFTNSLPSWVEGFKSSNPIGNYTKQIWNLSHTDSTDYRFYRQDRSKYETSIAGKSSAVFPYDLTSLSPADQVLNFTAMPFANTYLTDFALASLKGENLGKGSTTDFLCISYSTPDIAGHAFGPYSLEMEDMYFRLDAELARLFAALDKQVGKGEYVVFLTADHAVVPVPEYLVDSKLPGGYLFLNAKLEALRTACLAEFQIDPIQGIENNNVYLKKEFVDSPAEHEMMVFIQQEIAKWEEVKAVYTKTELNSVAANKWMEMTAAGYDRSHSGDVLFILQPGYLTKGNDTEAAHKGTSHGSAFSYDTQVPVLFYGKDIPKQDVFVPYDIIDIAASLVHVLDVQRPNAMTGKPMLELFRVGK